MIQLQSFKPLSGTPCMLVNAKPQRRKNAVDKTGIHNLAFVIGHALEGIPGSNNVDHSPFLVFVAVLSPCDPSIEYN